MQEFNLFAAVHAEKFKPSNNLNLRNIIFKQNKLDEDAVKATKNDYIYKENTSENDYSSKTIEELKKMDRSMVQKSNNQNEHKHFPFEEILLF